MVRRRESGYWPPITPAYMVQLRTPLRNFEGVTKRGLRANLAKGFFLAFPVVQARRSLWKVGLSTRSAH